MKKRLMVVDDSRVMELQVLVVDDSRMMELQICKLLENSKYEVVAYCENGEEAIARYEEVQPDIVTMDIIMPGIDGLEAAQVLLEEHPEARIVMVSSLICEETIQDAEAIGTMACLYKPGQRLGLLKAVDNALL